MKRNDVRQNNLGVHLKSLPEIYGAATTLIEPVIPLGP